MSRFDETGADPANHPRRETAPDRYGYRPTHGEEQACLGCGVPVTYDENIANWWVPYLGTGNVPRGTFDCTNRTFVRHMGSYPRMKPGQVRDDPRLRLIADMLAYLHLHLGEQHLRDFTAEQKELYADLVDANGVVDQWEAPDSRLPGDIPLRVPRTWRGDYAGPTSPADPRWHSMERYEPDPFAWAAEPLDEPDAD